MATTTRHQLPYPVAADPAVPHTDIKALAEKLDTKLDQIAPGQIVGPAAGQLLIANASGKVTGTAMSGDATITPTGAVTIGSKKIGTTKLDDKAVTTAKLDDGAVTFPKMGPWISAASKGVSSPPSNGTTTLTWPKPFPEGASFALTVTVSASLPCVCWVSDRGENGVTVGWSGLSSAPLVTFHAIGIWAA